MLPLTASVHGVTLSLAAEALAVQRHAHGPGGVPGHGQVQGGADLGGHVRGPGLQPQQASDEDDEGLRQGGGSRGTHGVPGQQLTGGRLDLHVCDPHLDTAGSSMRKVYRKVTAEEPKTTVKHRQKTGWLQKHSHYRPQ